MIKRSRVNTEVASSVQVVVFKCRFFFCEYNVYGIKTMAPRSRIKYKDNRLKMIEIVAKMLAARMRYFQK